MGKPEPQKDLTEKTACALSGHRGERSSKRGAVRTVNHPEGRHRPAETKDHKAEKKRLSQKDNRRGGGGGNLDRIVVLISSVT